MPGKRKRGGGGCLSYLPKGLPGKPVGSVRLHQVEVTGTPVRLDGYNYTLSFCYPRRMANSNRNDMLFSSGDSPNPSAIPLGDGLDEGKGESL